MSAPPAGLSLRRLLLTFLEIGCLSFGGPAAQIALIHRAMVDTHKMLTEEEFLAGLNFCMALPGPEAQQLATYTGWKTHGLQGALIAGWLFVLPGALLMGVLSWIYLRFGTLPHAEGVMLGLQVAAVVLVLHALQRLGQRALKSPVAWLLAGGAFVAQTLFSVPFPLIVLGCGLLGALLLKQSAAPAPSLPIALPPGSYVRSLRTLAIGLVLWLAPIAALIFALGPTHIFAQLGVFFAQAAAVTFGGAYAVLGYAADVATARAWLPPEMLADGLALAETTPGPLILVLQFMGFMTAARAETGLDPVLAGAFGAVLMVWASFVPSILWICVGAPYVQALSRIGWLSGALAGISAAALGVIASLGFWFASHVMFAHVDPVVMGPISFAMPDFGSVRPAALGLGVVALVANHFKAPPIVLVVGSGLLGLVVSWLWSAGF